VRPRRQSGASARPFNFTVRGRVSANPSFSDEVLQEAHRHSALHAEEIGRSSICGCFYCRNTFAPTEIRKWIDDQNVGEGRTGRTALCPKCGIDSVIGNVAGFPLTREFLEAMHALWFGG